MSFGSVQMISRLDSQGKFQMFSFSGRHIGGARRSTNMAASPYQALIFSAEHFDENLNFGVIYAP